MIKLWQVVLHTTVILEVGHNTRKSDYGGGTLEDSQIEVAMTLQKH